MNWKHLKPNSSYLNYTMVMTGQIDLSRINEQVEYNGTSKLSFWGSDVANTIGGTDALQFPQGLTTDDFIYIFSPDMLRRMRFITNNTVTVEGIELYSYSPYQHDFLNASLNPQNEAFYMNSPSGIANLSTANSGAPIFMSLPHFLHADSWFTRRIDGLNPIQSKHECLVNVEPITGTTMQVFERLQLVAKVDPIILIESNVTSDLYFPVFWVENSSTISKDLADDFKGQVYFAKSLAFGVKLTGLIAGGALLIIAIVFSVLYFRRRNLVGVSEVGIGWKSLLESDPVKDSNIVTSKLGSIQNASD